MQLGLFEDKKVVTSVCPIREIGNNNDKKYISFWKLVDNKFYLYDSDPVNQTFLNSQFNAEWIGTELKDISQELHYLSLLALKQYSIISFTTSSRRNCENVFVIQPIEPDEIVIFQYKHNPIDCLIVDDLKRKEKTIQSRLDQSQKLAEIGKMTAYITHELKSPLSSIKMNLELIRKKPDISEEIKKPISIIAKEVNRLNRLLKEILIFSGKAELTLVKVNFYKTIEQIRRLVNPVLTEKNITLKNHLSRFSVRCDSQKIQTLFQQLIENSIEAINSGGLIEIWDEVSTDQLNRNIFIKDSGCGVKEPLKIFDPFYTNKPGGTGLGLPIVKNIAKDHNWHFHFVSSDADGTVFRLELAERGGDDVQSINH